MTTRLLTNLLLAAGFIAAAAHASPIPQASIVFGAASSGPGGDTSVAVYATGLPANTILGAYDISVSFSNMLVLDATTPIVYNDAAFENLTAAPNATPVDFIVGQNATSIEAGSDSLLTSQSEFPQQNNGKNNNGEVLLFTLDFDATTVGKLDNLSSLVGNACNTGINDTIQLDSFSGAIIPACSSSSVPEPAPLSLLALGLVALALVRRHARRVAQARAA
jgi:hypothetical protein